jgi:hypothetical protein
MRFFVKLTDMSGLPAAVAVLQRARRAGLLSTSEADELRFWSLRAVALRGRAPSRLFTHMLIHFEKSTAMLSGPDEDAGRQTMLSARMAR